jgi:hypothetical protein
MHRNIVFCKEVCLKYYWPKHSYSSINSALIFDSNDIKLIASIDKIIRRELNVLLW